MTNFYMNRKGESGTVPFRSGRFYSVGTEWYFAVRRGVDQGPYDSKESAKKALVDYINDQLNFEKHLEETKGGMSLQSAI
jgi:hypothetical protein